MPSSDQMPIHLAHRSANAIVASLSCERPEEVGSCPSSLAFIKGKECGREVGRVLELCKNLKATVESGAFLRSLQRLQDAERTVKSLEEEYRENVSTTGCKTRNWHKTFLSSIEEAQEDRTFCAEQPFRLVTQNLEERDSIRFHGMSQKLKDEKSAFSLLLCFAEFIDSYYALDVELVMMSSAKVNAESTSDPSSQLVVRMQTYFNIIMQKQMVKKRPMGFARSPEVIKSYDRMDIDTRPLRRLIRPLVVSNEFSLELLNKGKKRPFTETLL